MVFKERYIFGAVNNPDSTGRYSTIIDFKKLGAAAGNAQVSFDVFNRGGQYKELPHGTLTVILK